LEWHGYVPAFIVESIDDLVQLLVVNEIFTQVCLHRFDLKFDLRHAMALGL